MEFVAAVIQDCFLEKFGVVHLVVLTYGTWRHKNKYVPVHSGRALQVQLAQYTFL